MKHRFLDNAKTMMLFKREVAICEELEHVGGRGRRS